MSPDGFLTWFSPGPPAAFPPLPVCPPLTGVRTPVLLPTVVREVADLNCPVSFPPGAMGLALVPVRGVLLGLVALKPLPELALLLGLLALKPPPELVVLPELNVLPRDGWEDPAKAPAGHRPATNASSTRMATRWTFILPPQSGR
jgi:hypothetical protein